MIGPLALLAGAYLCGSIPIGVLLSRARGVDPRDIGSGNIGATNVARAAGAGFGALTLAGDVLKGLVPVSIGVALAYQEPIVALVGLAAFFGHLYSCFLRFEGGKGVSTAFGALLGLAPVAAVIVAVVFAVTMAVWRYVSLASIVAATVMPLLLLALGAGAPTLVVMLTMSALIVLRHRDNIRRIRFGTEARIGRGRSSSADSGVA